MIKECVTKQVFSIPKETNEENSHENIPVTKSKDAILKTDRHIKQNAVIIIKAFK